MDCRNIEQLLSAKRAAELTSQQQEAVADHMWRCAACRRRWQVDVTNASPHANQAQRSEQQEQAASVDGQVQPPSDLGGFEILGRLGQGGMGMVFRVRQPSMDRIAVLKVLTGDAAWNESSLARFTREAQAAAAADHPNIIEVYDTGHDRGWHYIAMEYMEGGSLTDLIVRDGPLPPERSLAIMKQVTQGLAEAHRMGILHRDMKPSNILLNAKGRAKIADFGLAKRPDVDPCVTLHATMLGTPAYMAPEALRGEEYDARCDLYSLGATFYQLLAGRPPFMGATSSELVARHLETAPEPLTEAAPETPGPLAGIVHKLLEKNPADRYQSADDLLAALEGIGAPDSSDPGLAEPGRTAPGSLLRAVRRRPKTLVLAALTLGVIGALAGLIIWHSGDRSAPNPWVDLFDGETLKGWRVLTADPCDLPGKVYVKDRQLVLERAQERSTSIVWTGHALPRTNYEIRLDAMRIDGNSCPCHLAFPVGRSHCDLIVGGGGKDGSIVALDRVDDYDAADENNPTTLSMALENDRWYRIRVRVTPEQIDVWIDDDNVITLSLS